ncbi:hypothetical protein ACH492_10680 [Streptomyces sp. NPDC019443]|uniref:hypothetical protein n=1 Tax=Streptomyces sp. NPDC019443 TaxID=3365061 RepID=UPI0037A0760F
MATHFAPLHGGFAAVALNAIAQDQMLGLSREQRLRLDESAVPLDMETAKTLEGGS